MFLSKEVVWRAAFILSAVLINFRYSISQCISLHPNLPYYVELTCWWLIASLLHLQRWFVSKQVLRLPRVCVQGQATRVPFLWPDWSLTAYSEKNGVLFMENKKKPKKTNKQKKKTNKKKTQTKTNPQKTPGPHKKKPHQPKTLYPYWMVFFKLQSWSSRAVWSGRCSAQVVSPCIATHCNDTHLLDYFEEQQSSPGNFQMTRCASAAYCLRRWWEMG